MTTSHPNTKEENARHAMQTLKLVMKQQDRALIKLNNLVEELNHGRNLANIAYSDLMKIAAPKETE